LFFSEAVERAVSEPEVVGAPLRHGASGVLWKAAKVLVGSSLLLSALPASSRRLRRASGWLGTIGTIALRFAVVRAGRLSARDPRATFAHQRRSAPDASESSVRPSLRPPAAQVVASSTPVR